ncbi:MAG: alpha-L-fucosidase C-terminal domain-containing protein [Parabacteroides sp.]|nr:alpha-L-fucosidase C-terminal domain-containing protein [Parabacteroides sp.]
MAFTQKEESLYIIVKKWKKEAIVLSNVKNAGNVELLGYSGSINSTCKNGILTIIPPILTIDEMSSIHARVFKVNGFNQ